MDNKKDENDYIRPGNMPDAARFLTGCFQISFSFRTFARL